MFVLVLLALAATAAPITSTTDTEFAICRTETHMPVDIDGCELGEPNNRDPRTPACLDWVVTWHVMEQTAPNDTLAAAIAANPWQMAAVMPWWNSITRQWRAHLTLGEVTINIPVYPGVTCIAEVGHLRVAVHSRDLWSQHEAWRPRH
ncbi:MAG: hypothetical protein O3B64_01295 [bacterium]|nr:hypothetical protein [bacterium]MDA1024506.1 hypothetical protein [bacterium]